MNKQCFEKYKDNIKNYIVDFKKHKDLAVENSIPICWFGDIEEYEKSNYKIITVALNPSSKEFPKSKERFEIPKKWKEFLELKSDDKNISDDILESVYKTLNQYFDNNPYEDWFGNFEIVLNSIGATYYRNKKGSNVACENHSIHIDIYSAIATKKAWSALEPKEISDICDNKLFKEMLDKLKPDLVLISLSREKIINCFELQESSFIRYTYKKGIFIEGFKKDVLKIITGRNYRGKPFTASANKKEDEEFKTWVGDRIKNLSNIIDSL